MKKEYKQILKPLGLLAVIIIICASLSRHFGSSETLLEYQEKNGSTTTAAQNIVVEKEPEGTEMKEMITIENTATRSASVALIFPGRVTYKDGFYYEPLSENVKESITGITYPAKETEDMVITYDDLRYVSVKYIDFDSAVQTGELICNAAVAQDMVEIFYELYISNYQIDKMNLMETYGGDDDLACEDDNTSCFNYRNIDGTNTLSQHAYGLAIDINPFYNPYVTYNSDGFTHISPEGAKSYADRDADFPYKIDTNDLCYQLFIAHGFTWGGNWNHSKDYQHFQKVLG